VETAPEDVPVLQRRIVQASRRTGKPVIIATQMLESMTTAQHPTRAEASDVAGAIFERVDAVMLSGETAVGAHPVQATETMARIAAKAEESMSPESTDRRTLGLPDDVPAAVSAAVADLAEDVRARAIVVSTQSGATALAVARHRPHVDIVAATPDEQVARQMMLVGGVTPVVVPLAEDTDEMLDHVVSATMGAGLAESGDRVVIAAGVTTRTPGATDFLVVRRV
jgi:pyruvate kinase